MKILFIGDIVSQPGRDTLKLYLPAIKQRYEIDFVIANGENVAHGAGITLKTYQQLLELGVNVVTLGNHFVLHNEPMDMLDSSNLVRPLNIHPSIKGQGSRVFEVKGIKIRVTNLLGSVFITDLNPQNPFEAISNLLPSCQEAIHIIDMHAEATAEKLTMAWFLDGKVSALIGTHTHVQTADERILPNGLGYISDVGMCGPYNGIIGMKKAPIISKSITGLKTKYDIESGDTQFCACVIEIDENTSKTINISRIYINPDKIVGL